MFNFIFYKAYLFFIKQKYRHKPHSKASGIVGGIFLLNIFTILSIIKVYFLNYTINIIISILIIIFTIIITSVIFNIKKIKELECVYSSYTKIRMRLMSLISYMYIVFSVLLFFKYMVNLYL